MPLQPVGGVNRMFLVLGAILQKNRPLSKFLRTRHMTGNILAKFVLFSQYCPCINIFVQRVAQAAASVLGAAGAITHEALFVGVDLIHFAPVPGLAIAAHTLLRIWDAVQLVNVVFSFHTTTYTDLRPHRQTVSSACASQNAQQIVSSPCAKKYTTQVTTSDTSSLSHIADFSSELPSFTLYI